jgi:hypothetical protein
VRQHKKKIAPLNLFAAIAKNPPMPIDDNARGNVLSRMAEIHTFISELFRLQN